MNKTIFITGAASGLGKVAAKLFAFNGWTVIATMQQPELEVELTKLPNIHLFKLDICNKKQIIEIVEKAENIGPIDVLINNAAYGLIGALEGTTDEEIEQQIDCNFLGTILITKAFLPYFRKRKSGTIITVTSSIENIPDPFLAIYEITKSVLESWIDRISHELNSFGIGFETIVHAFMQINFGKNAQIISHQEVFNQYIAAMNLDSSIKRNKPESIADVVYKPEIDNKKQLDYTGCNFSAAEHEWLEKVGIEKVITTINKRFFEQVN